MISINQDWQDLDRQCVWHPFTQHGLEAEFLPVVSAQSAWLTLANGAKVLDGISSWLVNLHGHGHPAIVSAIAAQAAQLDQVIFAGFTHEPAVRLAKTLVDAANGSGAELTRCFYTDNGATAVEAALKMAYQYHLNQGVTSRTRFLALKNSYHGDTIGSMSVSARDSFAMHFADLLCHVDFVTPDKIEELAEKLAEHKESYCALIIEPMVQGVGGMQMHSAEFLQQVAQLCQEYGVLLICDEIFTGFYRTNKLFAFEYANIKPDLLCLSKGLTGGVLPLAATLATEAVFMAFQTKNVRDAFLHGHSFTGNPIACAAGLASFALLQLPETKARIAAISAKTKVWCEILRQQPRVAATRCLGTIGAVEIKNWPGYMSGASLQIRQQALKQGVLLRPFGSVIYALPPYCVTNDELDKIYYTIQDIVSNLN